MLRRALRTTHQILLPIGLGAALCCGCTATKSGATAGRSGTASGTTSGASATNTGSGSAGGSGTGPVAGATPNVRTVAVIDQGFDLHSPVLAGKVVASYILNCSQQNDDVMSTNFDSLTVEQIKQKLLAEINNPATCTLNTLAPLDYRGLGFSAIETYRSAWNAAIMSKQSEAFPQDVFNQINTVIGGSSGADYHGTMTAGTVAYKNPNVKIVLIQVKLSTEDALEDQVECHTQAAMDNYVQAYRDPAVMQAAVQASLTPVDKQLNQIAQSYNITVANESLGGLSRVNMQNLYAQKGCGQVDLTAYYNLLNDVNQQSSAYQNKQDPTQPQVLTVQSAGNDGIDAESFADNSACTDAVNHMLIVGSFDANRQISDFSNRGHCVDVYSLGSSVVVTDPDNFLTVESGTSFSAPLVTRYLSMAFDPSVGIDDLRTKTIAAADANHFMPVSAYPAELAYVAGQSPIISSFALAATPSGPAAVQPTSEQLHLSRFIQRQFHGWLFH